MGDSQDVSAVSSSDPLGRVFDLLQLSRSTYYHAEFAAPWAFRMSRAPKFHFVISGRCYVTVGKGKRQLLETGDFVVIPHGVGHRLSSDASARIRDADSIPCRSVGRRYSCFEQEGPGERTAMLCGDLAFSYPAASHLVAQLPSVMRVQAKDNHSIGWIHATASFMLVESRELRPGAEAILTRLADILVALAIRAWIETSPGEQASWLTALRDTRISSAIASIHERPGYPWTVASLAEAVSMSRSAFSSRFTKLCGESAMKYLARWRMHLASVYLQDGNRSVDDVARELGYQSAPGFSRAVKRFHGCWPGELRRDSGRR